MEMKLKPFFQVFLLIIVISAQLCKGCQFPSNIQSNDSSRDWRATIKNQNTEFTLKIQIIGNQLKTISTDDTGTSHTRVCLQSLPDNKYLVAHEQPGQVSTKYTCVQIIKRSKTVFQIKEAHLGNSMRRSLCDNDNLVLNDWLIIDEMSVHKEIQTCPIQGGFSIQVFDHSMKQGVCDAGVTGQTRLESECGSENGLYFLFRTQKCVPSNLYMYFNQRTLCLANWQQGSFTFVLLRHNHPEMKQYMWLFRFPTSVGESFVAVLLMDLVADGHPHVEATKDYLRLDLVRDTARPAHSLCLDEYGMCEIYSDPCSSSQRKLQCPRTCNVCHGSKPTLCTFPKKYQAQWYDAKNPGTLAVSINTTFMTTYNGQTQEQLHCVEWDAEKPSQNRNIKRQMLVKDYDNGCRPRYSCVEFMQKSNTILFFKLSQEQTWPFTDTAEDPIDCSHFTFDDSTSLTPNRFQSKFFNLVYLRATNSVPCDIPNNIRNFPVLFENETRCTASLTLNGDSGKSFTLQLPRKCPMTNIETHFTCIDSTKMLPRRDQLVITRSLTNSDLIHCWVFPKTKRQDIFYLLSAKDCNEAIKKRLNKDRLRYLAVFSRSGVFTSSTGPNKTPLTTQKASVVTISNKNPNNRQPPLTDKSAESNDVLNDDPGVLGTNKPNETTGEDNSQLEITATSAVIVGVVFTFAVLQTICICKS